MSPGWIPSLKQIRKSGTDEYYGDRFHCTIGDLVKWNEDESGYRCGREVSFDFGYSHRGDFDNEVYGERRYLDSRWYLTYFANLQIWRWGIWISLRGKRIGNDYDNLPEEDE